MADNKRGWNKGIAADVDRSELGKYRTAKMLKRLEYNTNRLPPEPPKPA